MPRVRQHRVGSPRGKFGNGCCLCITMDQLMCASIFPHPLLVRSEHVEDIGGGVYVCVAATYSRVWVDRVRLPILLQQRQGARYQTGRAQVGDALQQVPASGGRDGSRMSSAAILFCFTAGTFIPHASPSLQTRGGTCEHPRPPFARSGVRPNASYRVSNRVRGTGRGERGRGRDWRRGRERRR